MNSTLLDSYQRGPVSGGKDVSPKPDSRSVEDLLMSIRRAARILGSEDSVGDRVTQLLAYQKIVGLRALHRELWSKVRSKKRQRKGGEAV